jgi:hypothetical protein
LRMLSSKASFSWRLLKSSGRIVPSTPTSSARTKIAGFAPSMHDTL